MHNPMQRANEYPAEIIGYAEPWIVTPGDNVEIKVSSTEKTYSYRSVRLIQGFSGDHAPEVCSETIDAIPAGTCVGRIQTAKPGSYGVVNDLGLSDMDEGVVVEFYVEPHLIAAGHRQTLVGLSDAAGVNKVATVLTEDNRIAVVVGTPSSSTTIPFDFQLARHRWVLVKMKISDRKVQVRITSVAQFAQVPHFRETYTTSLSASPQFSTLSHLTLGALRSLNGDGIEILDFFNGKLDGVKLKAIGKQPRLLATYNFALYMSSDIIFDTSGSGRHGRLFNTPTRAVRGHDWDGSEVDWTKASFGYGAIHFHEDDLDDATWETDFTISIPKDARSGAYAVEVRGIENPEVFDRITFFVRPNPRSTAKIALVLSTFTYLAYSNEHMWDRNRSSRLEVPTEDFQIREDEDLKKMQRRSDLGLSLYDVHRDGSGMVYSTSKRPILNVRPGYIHWAFHRPREFSADLLMIGFLEKHYGTEYDVLTDHDMHSQGVAAMAKYTTVITGSHPEYHSTQTLDAWTHFAQRGGNIMYLGGNGFYWMATPLPDNTNLLEVRRGDQGVRTFVLPGGERHHSSNGAHGGLWRSRGRPANVLFGVGCCGEGLGPGVPYKRTAAASSSDYAWVFEGIPDDELLGEHGFGGGASGDEIDRFDLANGSPAQTVVLASSTGHSDEFGLFPEESGFPMVDTLGTQTNKIRSDITIYQTSGGGHVFSVGSINWYCALGWDGYNNNIARLVGNVIRRFTNSYT